MKLSRHYTYCACNSLTNFKCDRKRKLFEFSETLLKSQHVNLFSAGFSYLEPMCSCPGGWQVAVVWPGHSGLTGWAEQPGKFETIFL